ncbi:sugar transporter [Planktotalea lamellibrachiae]|nr:sugar transporter [Aliiroseovarius lamellibrachiae]
MKPRHRRVIYAFYLSVLVPTIAAAVYLFVFAKDQYASTMGFSVQSQETRSPIDLLGGITQLTGNTGSDTDILFEFMQSQRLVQNVDAALDLRSKYYQPSDPFFSLSNDASIEQLVKYWSRIVNIYYSKSTGLIEVRVTAYDPKDAQMIGQAIYDESVRMINDLSTTARNDATRYAREELQLAKDRMKRSREAIQRFRLSTQIVDPQVDIVGRMGVLNSLQEQLATAQIELDLLFQTAGTGDPRVKQVERRVSVIQKRLDSERERFSSAEGDTSGAYATLVGEYERLSVDRQFAETSYLSALSSLDTAVADAARKSRYLAAYIEPTLAETAEYPRRVIALATLAGFLFAAWAISVMIYYSIRDRR